MSLTCDMHVILAMLTKELKWRVRTIEIEYPIDLDWSNEEVISVINFFNHVRSIMNPA